MIAAPVVLPCADQVRSTDSETRFTQSSRLMLFAWLDLVRSCNEQVPVRMRFC